MAVEEQSSFVPLISVVDFHHARYCTTVCCYQEAESLTSCTEVPRLSDGLALMEMTTRQNETIGRCCPFLHYQSERHVPAAQEFVC